jgi:hypothetical protein
MRIIRTKQDITVLRRSKALPAATLEQVENYFLHLRDELEYEEDKEFRLGRNVYIVVLEAGNNVHDLSNVGLSQERGGLFGSCPEYVELLDVGKGQQAYKVAVLYDNDYQHICTIFRRPLSTGIVL